MTTINHDMADDVADWAINNMADLRTAEIDTRSDRARREWDEIEPWHLPHMTRVTNGCDQQGRYEHAGCGSCAGGKCHTPMACETPAGEEVESADREALAFIVAFLIFVGGAFRAFSSGEFLPAAIGAAVALVAFAALIGMLQP